MEGGGGGRGRRKGGRGGREEGGRRGREGGKEGEKEKKIACDLPCSEL